MEYINISWLCALQTFAVRPVCVTNVNKRSQRQHKESSAPLIWAGGAAHQQLNGDELLSLASYAPRRAGWLVTRETSPYLMTRSPRIRGRNSWKFSGCIRVLLCQPPPAAFSFLSSTI